MFLLSCSPEKILFHGELTGTVTDASSNQPVRNATITLNQPADTTYTGIDGKYIFKGLMPGNYNVQVSKENYFQTFKSVVVFPESQQQIDFNLEKTPLRKISARFLDFGFDSTIKKFTISNTGNGRLYYLVTSDADWITVSSSSASGFLTDKTDTITVTLNKISLSPGKHQESIIVWSNSGPNWLADSISVFLNGILDQDLNLYEIVTIGSQTWMAENLNVGNFVENTNLKSASSNIQKHCYNNVEENCSIYGGLYTWKQLMLTSYADNGAIGTTQGICPDGWHVPTVNEWTTLINALGGYLTAGGKLKETGTSHWLEPNNATGTSGFNALPSGADFYYKFSGIENTAFFWSSSVNPAGTLHLYSYESYQLTNTETSVLSMEKDELYYFSARCIKNPDKH